MRNISAYMARAGILEKDIRERFIRAGGPGGQHVNKTASCVYLKHIPTGIEVKCQGGRSQSANCILARQILVKRVWEMVRRRSLYERNSREKLRRQNRKPSLSSSLKRLDAKKRHSVKKKMRLFGEEC